MAIEKLDHAAWHPYFDAVSRLLPARLAEIEVDGLDIGAQIEAHFAPLYGIVYDPGNDLIEVLLEGLDHTISHPAEVFIDHDGVRLNSVAVTDNTGRRQLIRLRDPVLLPAPVKADAGLH